MCPYNDLATVCTVVSWNLSRNVAVNWHIKSNGFYFIIAITHLPDLWSFLVHKFCLCFLNNYLSSITWKPWTIYAGSKKTWTLWYLLSFFFINKSAFQNDLFLYLHFFFKSSLFLFLKLLIYLFILMRPTARLLVFVKYSPQLVIWSCSYQCPTSCQWLYLERKDTSKALRFIILWKNSTENGFDNMFCEYIANSWENLGNRVHFHVTCFQFIPSQMVYSVRNILLKFIRNFGTHEYSSEHNSEVSGGNLQIFCYYYKF